MVYNNRGAGICLTSGVEGVVVAERNDSNCGVRVPSLKGGVKFKLDS